MNYEWDIGQENHNSGFSRIDGTPWDYWTECSRCGNESRRATIEVPETGHAILICADCVRDLVEDARELGII